jgi:hypothetical protein
VKAAWARRTGIFSKCLIDLPMRRFGPDRGGSRPKRRTALLKR